MENPSVTADPEITEVEIDGEEFESAGMAGVYEATLDGVAFRVSESRTVQLSEGDALLNEMGCIVGEVTEIEYDGNAAVVDGSWRYTVSIDRSKATEETEPMLGEPVTEVPLGELAAQFGARYLDTVN